MSIASEITRINTNISAAYTSATAQGAMISQTQNSANLASTIDSIDSYQESVRKDINFYDYKGKLIRGFTFSEAQNLSSFPTAPNHPGLTGQGWNYTKSEVISAASNGYPLDVGRIEKTTDEKTKLYFFVAKGTRIRSLTIFVVMDGNKSTTIDWGDGTTGTIQNTGSSSAAVSATKTNYSEVTEDTIICVSLSESGDSYKLGTGGTNNIFGVDGSTTENLPDTPVLIKVETGVKCNGISDNAFYYCNALQTVVLSNHITEIGKNAFNQCTALRAIVVPRFVTSISERSFYNCYGLKVVSLPLSIAPSVSTVAVDTYAFYFCSGLTNFDIPNSITIIPQHMLRNCHNLTYVSVPKTITKIGGGSFNGCRRLCVIDMTDYGDSDTLPMLENTNALNNTPSYLTFKVSSQTVKNRFLAMTNWTSLSADSFVVG